MQNGWIVRIEADVPGLLSFSDLLLRVLGRTVVQRGSEHHAKQPDRCHRTRAGREEAEQIAEDGFETRAWQDGLLSG